MDGQEEGKQENYGRQMPSLYHQICQVATHALPYMQFVKSTHLLVKKNTIKKHYLLAYSISFYYLCSRFQ